MNEKQALASGYCFVGIYERDVSLVKDRRDREFTAKGYKAVIVTVPDSPLTRGGRGIGYSVYAEPRYFIDREKSELQNRLSRIEATKALEFRAYKDAIKRIEDEEAAMLSRLDKLNKLD